MGKMNFKNTFKFSSGKLSMKFIKTRNCYMYSYFKVKVMKTFLVKGHVVTVRIKLIKRYQKC